MIKWLVRTKDKIANKIQSFGKIDNKYGFQKLTPIDNVELSFYEDAIDFIFKNKDIKNVAISGAYCSGKSSVLESYKKKHKRIRFLHISLAHFKTPNETERETNESVLEGKILNQLIHQIPPKRIPQTNFKIKKKISIAGVALCSLLIMLFAASLLHIMKFDVWSGYISSLAEKRIKDFFQFSIQKEFLIISGTICATISGIFAFYLTNAQKSRNRFKKINVKGSEIEFFEDNHNSYFDKYLNDVLYVFCRAKASVIVFEDMDRYNADQIFERLREVNVLIDIKRKRSKKSPMRFFYLLKDEIFTSKDRTKFFDYIIPIVPIVDSSNSYDQFIHYLKNGGIFGLFNEKFLQGLSLYVDDMRLLKNIYNEFMIYNGRLNTTELNHNKLLAMITYKNIFPSDYSDLQLNRGFVYTLFYKKDAFIEEEIATVRNQIIDLRKKVTNARNEHLNSQSELDVIYGPQITELEQQARYNGKRDVLNQKKEEFSQRKQALKIRETNEIGKIEEEIGKLESRILSFKKLNMKGIITQKNSDTIFNITYTNEIGRIYDFNNIKESEYFDLLKFLIRNAYIDEYYPDYMTYFYENSLSKIDKTFLRSITDKRAKEYSYSLKEPKKVLDRLSEKDFDEQEVLNFDLLDYLLQNKSDSIFLGKFIDQLKEKGFSRLLVIILIWVLI